MLKAFDLNADLPSLAILHKKASRMGGRTACDHLRYGLHHSALQWPDGA